MIWRAVGWLWVLAPVIGALPSVPDRLARVWWWSAVSVLVIAVGWLQPVKHKLPKIWGVLLLTVWALWFVHLEQADAAYLWLIHSLTVLVAAVVLVERSEWPTLREALLFAALIQLPFMLAQYALGWPYLAGSVSKRPALAILLATGSLFSRSWLAWILAAGAVVSGGLVGAVPAVGRLLWPWIQRLGWIGLVASTGIFLFTSSIWMPKALIRLSIWQELWHMRSFWPTGYGLLRLPIGFQDLDYWGNPTGWIALNNTFLDWLVRAGALGFFPLLFLLVWTWRNSPRVLWLSFMWMAFWSSFSGMPAAIVCGLFWLIALSQRRKHADSLQVLGS